MKKIREYIESGLLEFYVLGLATPLEVKEVEEMAKAHDEVRAAIDEFSKILEKKVRANAVAPDPVVKPMLMATLNYIDRLEKGEKISFAPLLYEGSKISDYEEWLSRSDMFAPADFNDIHARIIAHTPEATTAIVWIKDFAPGEVHTDELERFLIVEGTCDITIEKDTFSLVPGDFLAIPLFKDHMVKVTSDIPCKVILQRVAA